MSENSLFQFAQVIADQPTHHHPQPQPPPPSSSSSASSSPQPNQRITLSQPPPYQATRSSEADGPPMAARRYLPIRKNACIVCGVCFTCSREVQPRRGKNLPEGSLDSRAKKLHPQDKEDYEFSMNWLSEHAHAIYKDESGTVVGLRDLSEVSLCKAHSSTLYRAKKRHERGRNQAPPSPADSNGIDMVMDRDSYPLHPHPNHHYGPPPPLLEGGGIAAKVREMQYHHPHHHHHHHHHQYRSSTPPDFSMMQPSSSLKRKRISKQQQQQHPSSPSEKPHSSASTPLYATGMAPLLSHHPSSSSSSSSGTALSPRGHDPAESSFSLPPLHSRASSLSALSSSFQNHLHLSGPYPTTSAYPAAAAAAAATATQPPPPPPRQPSSSTPPLQVATSANSTSTGGSGGSPPLPQQLKSLETVSLKSMDTPSKYYFRNLAITDTFTFRDLLKEIDMTGTPPAGKRIVVSDEKNETFFPLDQAIRSVIQRPLSTHMELCLGLSDKPSIDWSSYA
ncbi:hypothetical protein BDB00DRAFT_871191 [Zychaea mexicana]|uniref:uncharacterized protein n=1 Tax=Zychaea mexicana TaxID=64656 RepID=UPI0022FECA19|nr:uncharacterized protein BDB00DRAFT_871191 [Zychaea mexicana]KAI9494640.1 hypothetical protein BDB00DRAFT_871191 [Zychaea mexicana]